MEKKPKKVKILQICVSEDTVFGLGSDQRVYVWIKGSAVWYLEES